MTLSDHELDLRLATLQRKAQPPARAWKRLQARIDRKRRLPAWLAAVACVAVVSLVLVRVLDSPFPASAPDPAEMRVAAELELLRQDSFAPGWSPALERAEGFTEAWQENEAAIAALKQALDADPNNLLLLEFLAEARFRQTDLIQLTARVQHPSPLTE